jgi:hypothetical protein
MSNCKHKETEMGYGFGFGFRGLGIYTYCVDCDQTVDWSDDSECNTPEEIEHNKKVLDGLSQSKH